MTLETDRNEFIDILDKFSIEYETHGLGIIVQLYIPNEYAKRMSKLVRDIETDESPSTAIETH